MKRKGLTFIILVAVLSSAASQEVKVTTAFDTSRIYIGDQVKYTLTIEKPVSFLLSYPIFKDTLYSKIEILGGPDIDTSFMNDGRMKIRHEYLVTAFDSGYYQVPPVFAELRSQSGIRRFYSDYSPLEVTRVKIAPQDSSAQFFDIIKPYRSPVTLGEILPWLLLAIILAAIIWAIVMYIKKLRIIKSGEPVPEVIEPAHVIAFRELEQLREEKLWQNGEIKMYYTRLSEILRQYLENRYRIFALEYTTVETLDHLQLTGFKNQAQYNKLKSVLTDSDLVKFAKHKPGPVENDLNFEMAWNFVDLTKMIPEEPPENNTEKVEKKEEEAGR